MNTLVKVVWIISALTLSFSYVYATPVPPGPPILNIVNSASTNDACQGSVSELQAVIGSYYTTEFQVGNSGPRGGLISYDKGNDNEGWRYLQIAPYDIVLPNSLIAGFGCECQNVNAFSEVPGSGYENFQAWVNSPCANEWLQYLDTLHILGFDDWYIPSLSELTSIYGQLSNQSTNYIEPLNPDFYWTSSAANFGSCGTSGGIYQLSMQSGTASIVDRNFSIGRIRLVRRFSNIPSYLWNTGSTESSIQISNADAGYNTYSVQVSAFLYIIKSQFGGFYNSEIANASIQIYVYPNIQVSSDTIFAGDSVLINGIYRKEAGAFSDTFNTAQGCDSIVVINLVVIQSEIDCNIGIRRENNQWRLSLPFYDPEGPAFAQNTTVYNWSNGANTASILVGQNGSGVYSVSVSNGQRSCEASIGLNLNLPSSTNIDTTLSAGQSIVFNGQNLNQSGTYTAIFQNAAGCDSVVTLNLIVELQPLTCELISTNSSICFGDSTNIEIQNTSNQTTGNSAIFNSGTPNPWNYPSPENGGYIPLGPFGTPSVFSISCYINPSDIQSSISIILDCNHGGNSNWVIQNYPNIGSGSNWSFGNLPISLTPNSWQHLLITYNNGNRRCFVDGVMQSESYQLISWSGSPSLFLGNWPEGARRFHGGIDELYITYDIQHVANFTPANYITNPSPSTFGLWHFDEAFGLTTQSVSGTNFNLSNWSWTTRSLANSIILWSTGETTPSITVSPSETTTYTVTINQGSQTCTSEVTIFVNQPATSTTSVSSCLPYTWNGNTYTQSGNYTWTGTSSNGCDSIATLNLTVNSSPNVSFEPDNTTYCNNSGSVDLNGGSPAGGVYSGPGVSNGEFNPAAAGGGLHPITYSYTNANGCSSSATVTYEVAVCTGVEVATQPALEVRPNPMESSTFVSLKNYTGTDAQFSLLLMDATGREVFRKTVSAEVIREGYHLQIPELASGTYVLMLNNVNYTGVKRLVK